MKVKLALVSLSVSLCGCEMLQHTVCAPKLLVETCLQEAYPQQGSGWGPGCTSLNEWAKLHNYAVGGGPPLTPKPSPEQLKALETKDH